MPHHQQGFKFTALVVIGTDCIGKSNYHTFMTMIAHSQYI